MQTLADLLDRSARRWPARPAVLLHGSDPWGWTYAELWQQSRRAAAYLQSSGVGRGDRVVLWGPNRPEWVAAFFGIALLGAAVVPLDARSREELLGSIEAQTTPKHLLLGDEQAAGLHAAHAPVTSFSALRERSAAMTPADQHDGSGPDDIAELVYTSGTTGSPKGVILSHRNILSNMAAGRQAFMPSVKNRVLSLLPLSHMFELQAGLLIPLTGGASITYVPNLRPDVIFAAMARMHITNMACVPQVLQLFRAGIEREVEKQGKTRQFQRLHALARRLPLPLRRLLFRPIHQRMGGRFDYFVSGGAYLDPQLARWWEGLGIKVAQGYGMTEASPVVASNTLTDRDVNSLGRPVAGVSVKFDQDAEILIRGENVTRGYWQDPRATAEAFVDGWYCTGDLGYLDPTGRLHLHGRKKNVIVLANGLNVYPEDVERVLLLDSRVKDAVVFGLAQGQEVEIHAVLLTDHAREASQIIRTANRLLAPQQHIRHMSVWPDETFPLTPTLKPKRAEIAERLPALATDRLSN